MSNFKVGDEVICIRDCRERAETEALSLGAPKVGDILTVNYVRYSQEYRDTYIGFEETHPDAEYLASAFRKLKPKHIHSTRSIQNLSVVKELSRLPLVKETTEVPVRKQEGVEI